MNTSRNINYPVKQFYYRLTTPKFETRKSFYMFRPQSVTPQGATIFKDIESFGNNLVYMCQFRRLLASYNFLHKHNTG